MTTRITSKINNLDKIGIILSGLCAIHCTMTPLVLLFLPALGKIFQSESFHITMFLIITPVALFTFINCYKQHKSKFILGLGLFALSCLTGGLLVEEYSHDLEKGLTVLGTACIIVAHVMNIRTCRCLKNSHQHCYEAKA